MANSDSVDKHWPMRICGSHCCTIVKVSSSVAELKAWDFLLWAQWRLLSFDVCLLITAGALLAMFLLLLPIPSSLAMSCFLNISDDFAVSWKCILKITHWTWRGGTDLQSQHLAVKAGRLPGSSSCWSYFYFEKNKRMDDLKRVPCKGFPRPN